MSQPKPFILQPGVAYMPVPRCDSCQHWEPRDGDGDDGTGHCWFHTERHGEAKMYPDMYDAIITTADFGCVQWEAKKA